MTTTTQKSGSAAASNDRRGGATLETGPPAAAAAASDEAGDVGDAGLTGVSWAAATDTGRFRKDNEDAFILFTCRQGELVLLGKSGEGSLGERDYVFAVSDGMGGANLGERASRMVIEELKILVPRAYQAGVSGFRPDYLGVLEQAIHRTHTKINIESRAYSESSGMGATLTLVWLNSGALHFAHVGDSRLYYLHDGGCRQLSHDHTAAGRLFRLGRINERQAKNHPQRHILHQALGANIKELEPQLGTVRLHPGDRFLLCSDGLTDGLWDRRLGQLLAQDKDCAGILADMMRESLFQSAKDNTTAIVLEVR